MVLLEVDDPRFPPYFRLYWHEMAVLIQKEQELRDTVLKILCKYSKKYI